MSIPPISGPEEFSKSPLEKVDKGNPSSGKTDTVSKIRFKKVCNETLEILSVLEQYEFNPHTRAAFKDLSTSLSEQSDSIEVDRISEIFKTSQRHLSLELKQLGVQNLEDFRPAAGIPPDATKFMNMVEVWEKDIQRLIESLKIEAEISALPSVVLQFELISPRIVQEIKISRETKASMKEVTEDQKASFQKMSNEVARPEINNECIRMGTSCAISPNDSQIMSTDFTLELETAFASRFFNIFGNSSGHNPQGKPESLSLRIADNVMTTLTRLDQLPEMKESETLLSFSFPTLILRPKRADSSMMTFVSVHNKYPSAMNAIMHQTPDELGIVCQGCEEGTHFDDNTRPYECINIQSQYSDIKRQCDDLHVSIVGKCDVIQRVVHRDGFLIFEKGVSGHSITELMRVPIYMLKKPSQT